MENDRQRPGADQRRATYMAEFGLSDEHIGTRVPTMAPTDVDQDMVPPPPGESSSGALDPLELARTEVRLAEARFSHRVRRVSDVSELAVREAISSTRPLLMGALLIGGASATLALVAAVRTFRRRTPIIIRHEQVADRTTPVLRSMLMSVGLLIMRRVAERALERFQNHQAEQNAGDAHVPVADPAVTGRYSHE